MSRRRNRQRGGRRTASRRGRTDSSPAVRKTIRFDAAETATPSPGAAKRSATTLARAKAAGGGGNRRAPRGGALDPRGTPANQRRSAGLGRKAHAARPHHARRSTGKAAY